MEKYLGMMVCFINLCTQGEIEENLSELIYNQSEYLLRDTDKKNEDLVKPVFVTEMLII